MKWLAMLLLGLADCSVPAPPPPTPKASVPLLPPMPPVALSRPLQTTQASAPTVAQAKVVSPAPTNVTVQLDWDYTNWSKLSFFAISNSFDLSNWTTLTLTQTNSWSTNMPASQLWSIPHQFFKVVDYGSLELIELGWNPVSDAAGYRLYLGPADGDYTNVVDCSNQTWMTVPFPQGVTFFSVSVYDSRGIESALSSSISATNGDFALGSPIKSRLGLLPH